MGKNLIKLKDFYLLIHKRYILIFFLLISSYLYGNKLLIPMDFKQTDHLRAYGVVYNTLKLGFKGKWLLNFRGGSFLLPYDSKIVSKALGLGVAFEIIDINAENEIYATITTHNMEAIHLEKCPKIAVYTPESSKPWDDAVTLVLEYANIPYEKIYDEDILKGRLKEVDWLHLHHEDFTGQFSKFYASFRNSPWYQLSVLKANKLAKKLGFSSVSEEKKQVALEILKFVKNGGLLFAMCYATESLDVALASIGVDIVSPEIDGTPVDPDFEKKINYNRCLAFTNFNINTNILECYLSDIDYNHVNTPSRIMARPFKLFEFSAKFDPIPCILTQNHESVIKGFYGLTTSFNKKCLKKDVIILGDIDKYSCKYIYRKYGKGSITFYGGHDPEDYSHAVNDPPTDLSKYPNSPGYRLILNNILFPAAEKKKLKT